MFDLMPRIVYIGAYDASLVYKNTVETKQREVFMFEAEIATEDGGISYFGDEAYPVKKYNVIFAKPGQMRHTRLPYKSLYIHVVVEDETLSRLLYDVPDIFLPSNKDEYESIFKTIIAAYTSHFEYSDVLVQSKLLELFAMLIKEKSIQNVKKIYRSKNSHIIRKALLFIDNNYKKNITLEDIAAHVSMSKIYFHNMFIAATGKTTHRYILEKRLACVKNLLITTDKTIADIAYECGFSSQSYLNYIFKKECGITPKTYVKQMSELWDK